MATIFLGQKSSLTSRIKVLKWTILSSCHQTSNVWIIPKRSELVRSLILNYSTFFLELVLYWLILNIDSLLMWQFLSLFRSIKCWIILSNKKKFENRNKDGILQSVDSRMNFLNSGKNRIKINSSHPIFTLSQVHQKFGWCGIVFREKNG